LLPAVEVPEGEDPEEDMAIRVVGSCRDRARSSGSLEERFCPCGCGFELGSERQRIARGRFCRAIESGVGVCEVGDSVMTITGVRDDCSAVD
jgi:hypothetical protein